MVRRSSFILFFSLLFLIPTHLFALGLGEIDVDSALNQPLDARINLISARADELEEMRVELAPADVFDRVGVPRPYYLTQLKFEPITLPDGSLAIRVTSKDPVREPFLTFLVEVTWPKGRLLREYTILLDPPEFAQQQAPQVATPVTPEIPITEDVVVEDVVEEVPEEVAAEVTPTLVEEVPVEEVVEEPVVTATPEVADEVAGDDIDVIRAKMDEELGIDHSEPVVSAEVEEITPSAEDLEEAVAEETQEVASESLEEDIIVPEDIVDEEVAEAEPLPEVDAVSVPAGDYTTVKGDTLYAIAKATRGTRDVTVNQMMLAIQQVNPDAFIKNNINLLKTGVVLRIPDEVDTAKTPNAAAVAEVARQNGLWREYRGQVTEKMAAVNVDAPDLVEEATDSSDEFANQAKEVQKEPAQVKQDLNILAGEDGADTGSTQLAGGEELEKIQKEQAVLKELVQSRENENEDLKSRVEALESMLEKKDKIINIQNDQLNNLKQQLDTETNKAIKAEKLLQEKTSEISKPKPEEPKPEVTPPAKVAEVKPPTLEPLPDWDSLPEIEVPEETPKVEETVAAKPKLEPLPDWDSLPEIELPGEEVAGEEVATEETPAEETIVAETETPAEEVKPAETVQPQDEPAKAEGGIVATLMGYVEPLREHALKGAVGLGVLAILGAILSWRQKRSAKRIETIGMGGMPAALEDDEFDDILDETIVTQKAAPVAESESIEEVFEPTADADVGATDSSPAEATTPDDVLEEADVYISYGLHQQAQDLLNDAIAAEPGRNDYKVKLAEVFYSAKDQSAFEKHAETIKDQVGESSSDWQNIIAMGKEIAPSSALFAGAAAVGVAASAFAEKPDETDIDIGLQTAINEPLSDDDLEDTIVDNSDDSDDEGLDFNIDEQVTESFDDDPVASKIMEANETSDILNFEIDDLADASSDNLEGLTDNELDSIATGIHEATGINELNIDEEMTEELEEVGLQTTMNDLKPLDMDEEDMDTTVALQTEDDFGVGLDTAANPDTLTDEDPEATAAYMADVSNNLDETEQFDSSNLDTEFLDPAEATVAQTATDLEELGPPSLIEEVGTKLDLAKAFVDMGDSDAAKETLIEVINEGDESQIKAAKDLMDKLGG